MNRAVIENLMAAQPDDNNRYIYIQDDISMCQAITLAGHMALFLSRDVTKPEYFTFETFHDYINSLLFKGTFLNEYTFVPCCKRKSLNTALAELFQDAGVKTIEGWKLFYNKDYLTDARFQPEMSGILERFERANSGPCVDDQLRNRFCKTDKYGNSTSIIDKLLIDYLMETQEMFVCMGHLYIYSDGVYSEDVEGVRIKNIMQQLLYTEMIKARTLNGLYSLLLMQEELQRSMEEVNCYPVSWINFRNGMLDVETLELHPHSPVYYSINQIPHDYCRDFKPECWQDTSRFLESSAVSGDDIRMLLTYMGLCMTRDTRQQVFMMLKGEAGTGKSRVIHLFEYIVGKSNISNVSLQDLNKRFYPSNLFCKLMNTCADISSAAMEDVDVIKKATGEDILMYERKGEDAGSFSSYAKLLFSANKMPMNLDEKSNAYYRRLLIYEMNKVPEKEDRGLDQKLEAEAAMTINRAVQALHEMYLSESGRIPKSPNSCRLVLEQHMNADSILAFIEERCIKMPEKRVNRTNLYNAYIVYCQENERMGCKKRQFFTGIEEKGYVLVKVQGIFYFRGLVLSDQDVQELRASTGRNPIFIETGGKND